MTSPDGITWTSRTSPSNNNDWYAVTWGGPTGQEKFVAVANNGDGAAGDGVMTSPDGITWTTRTSASDEQWYGVTYAAGLYVAVGTPSFSTTALVMTSPDGITWTIRTAAADSEWSSIAFGGGLFVAMSTSSPGNIVMTSPDGITWTSRTSAADNSWTGVTYANGLFVAVAKNGTGNRVMTSGTYVRSSANAVPLWMQAVGRQTATDSCPDGYTPSWAAWPNRGTGGWVCNRFIPAYGN
jgi:hypothetical protein